MRRAPVIILCLLVLLSIIGAGISQRLRKPALSFSDVDSFLKHQTAADGWRFHSQNTMASWRKPHTGWWDHLRIRRFHQLHQEEYFLGHASGKAAARVWVVCKDGKVVTLLIVRGYPPHRTGEPDLSAGDPALLLIEDLEKTIHQQFPGFAPSAPPPAASP